MDNQRKIAESEMRLSKANHKLCIDKIKKLEADIADRIRYTVELEKIVTKLNEENDSLAGIVGGYQQELTRNTEKLKTAILKAEELEKRIQKYYEYERQFRKKIKELTEENKSLQIQNLLLKAICKD